MHLLIARHGETAHNTHNLCSGQNSVLLTLRGRRQARRIGQQFRIYGIHSLFSSDLPRAVQTCAEILISVPRLVQFRSELRERNFGSLEGLPSSEYSVARIASGLERSLFRPNGGESFEDLKLRISAFLPVLIDSLASKNVGIIAHSNINRCLLTMLLGGSPGDYEQNVACINILSYFPEKGWEMVSLNDTSHLELGAKVSANPLDEDTLG